MSKVFRPWKTDEAWLLPPSVAGFVSAGHPAHLLRDLVSEKLDLSAILGACTEMKGYPPYHPAMMVALLLYAYRSGVYSSRRIARACEERLDFQAVTALNQLDFRTISEFRRRDLNALSGLFVQVPALCRKAARPAPPCDLDGNPKPRPGRVPQRPPGQPKPKVPRNFTDSESRIMKGRDGFIQAYNAQAYNAQAYNAQAYSAQAAVDADAQIIVTHRLTNNGSDQDALLTRLDAVAETTGEMTNDVSADNGFCSEANPEGLLNRKVRGYVAAVRSSKPADGKKGGKRVQARGFRQFLLRGINKVKAEWAMICTAHNLAKLTRYGNIPTFARQTPARQNAKNMVAGTGSQTMPQTMQMPHHLLRAVTRRCQKRLVNPSHQRKRRSTLAGRPIIPSQTVDLKQRASSQD